MTISGSSPTHSPQRIVPSFYRHLGSVFLKTTSFVLKVIFFSYMASASVSESMRTWDMGWSFRHSSRITNLLECVFT